MTLSTPKSELTSSRMFVRKTHAEVAYWIDTDAAAMDGQPGRNNHVAASRSAAERLLAADDALGFIDQTIYANEDSNPLTPWRNEEVLALLGEIRMKMLAEPVDREIERQS